MKIDSELHPPEADTAFDYNGTPASAAPAEIELPDDGKGEGQGQGDSWEGLNAKLKKKGQSEEPKDGERSEIERLRKELELERQKTATEEKRRKDAQKAFKERSEELKRLKAEAEAAVSVRSKETQKLQDDLDSGNIAAPESKADWNQIAKDYGLTEAEKEVFEMNPEFRTGIEKILSKRLDSGLSERERKAKDAEHNKLEAEITDHQQKEMIGSIARVHPDVEKVIASPEFNAWLKGNEALCAGIRAGKETYDPSVGIEIMDHFSAYQDQRKRIQQKRNYGRQATVSHPSVGGGAAGQDNSSWKALNAKIERDRSS